MALLFRMATVEVTERYSAGRWAGLEYPVKPSRMQQGLLEGRTLLGLATKRQTQRPFPQSPGSGTSYMAAQGYTIVRS